MFGKTLEILGRATGKAIENSLAPLATRLATVEARTGAMAMMLARSGSSAELVKEYEAGLARMADLERRLAEMESRASLKYLGIWNAETQYNAGNIVTDHGSAWHCARSTRSRPGTDDSWVLMVKRGTSARDAR